MNRIEALRGEALHYPHSNDEFFYRFYRQYESSTQTSDMLRYAEAFSCALSALSLNLSRGELIVGKVKNNMTADEQIEWDTHYEPIRFARYLLAGRAQDSHMSIDYELILSLGIRGILARIEGYEALTTDPEKLEFYSSAKTCLRAVLTHAERYAALAEQLAADTDDQTERAELLEVAEICRTVPANPAKSFHEALQSVHFVTYCVSFNPLRRGHQQFQLGHPDRYLLPYYEADLASGALTKERARLLLDCLGIQINNRVPNGLSSGYMVGGRDENGAPVANELTEMLMQVIDDIRLVYPAVGLCYTEDTPSKYLTQACEILSHGRSHPAIFNDALITEGLIGYGVPKADAHDYIHSTCVEITPTAASNAWVASPYTNLAQLLLDTMTREYASFEEHLAALFAHLDTTIEQNFREQNGLRRQRSEHAMNPLLSCFVKDCLARGKDIERGGARYNWIMPSFVGMANLVDSVYALRETVYEKKALTVREFKEILDSNFEGRETLRRHLLEDLPKYGNDVDEIDAYCTLFTEHIVAACKKYVCMHSEGKLIPSVFCWVMHERFGKETGATPDGRRAGFPLGDGSGPCQGREKNGPTASILSSTKWNHTPLIGGVAVNIKFAKSSLGPHSVEVMRALIQTYLERGGFEIQINVTDKEILEAARRNPEQYADLVVRIGGYSDYFTRLTPEMQEEVILRTEHRI